MGGPAGGADEDPIALAYREEEFLAENGVIYNIVKSSDNVEWEWTFLHISGVIWIISKIICEQKLGKTNPCWSLTCYASRTFQLDLQ